jgi:hypothetical protein
MFARKSKFWLKQQSRRQWRRYLTWFFGLLLVFLIINLVWRATVFINFLGKPFQELPGKLSHSDGVNIDKRVNILLFSLSEDNKVKEAVVAFYKGEDKVLSFFPIYPDTHVRFSDGTWGKIEDLYQEGEKEFSNGLGYLAHGVGEILAVPVDSYVAFTGRSFEEGLLTEKSLRGAHQDLKSPLFFLDLLELKSWGEGYFRTSFSLGELMKLVLSLRGVRYDRLNYLDAEKLVQEVVLDDRKFTTFNQDALDSLTSEVLSEAQVVAEGASVGIRNSTQVSGLGGRVSRFVTRLGGRVAQVGNAEEPSEETLINNYGGKDYTAERIQRALGVGRVIKPLSTEPSKEDILIILGKDYQEQFSTSRK